ncbi:flagellar motor switch protein FliM [Candidatus Paraluminiphilus aquimaris]|uniref:Flagellar motor switch protein FliM n=1 Tax=Candidatus Paraluminiphilus aquimaris TaxID=2518994 RepID=A0ABY6Q458_9GAMM|nr:FliM/FliN family flagellar motor switch protein [Candidatus Paraluminiphilus aquimaris]UZP73809.1 flagellar motor switch protein FliM [Candidatus Paraluminiphilus aquimaris]
MVEESDNEPVLTDEEIEALVEHAQEGGFDDGEFRIHDFSAGESLTLSKWSELEGLHRNHAEALGKALSSAFDLEIGVEPRPSSYAVARDLLIGFPQRMCLVSTQIGPFEAESHLLISGETLSFLVNQYFGGGSVTPPKLTAKVTPSEQRIGERVARDYLRTMSEIWVDRLALQMSDLYIDVTPDRFALIPEDEGFAVFDFELSIGDGHQSLVQLLIPFDSLETQSSALVPTKKAVPEDPAAATWEPQLRSTITDVSVELSGSIDAIETTIKSLLAMKVGVTIPIQEPDAMALLLNGRAVAHGRYGAHEGLKAMQFTHFKERES